jgi:hypothetical protein
MVLKGLRGDFQQILSIFYPPFKTTLWSLRSGEFTIQITYEKGRLLEKSLRHF